MTQLQTNYAPDTLATYDIRNNQENISTKKGSYGRTIGEPKLSDEAKKYYDQLKKKFNNYDFILVSRDEKENVKANAAKYAGGLKTVVLIDEDKIERMATDAEYRKKYEDILNGAMDGINSIKSGLSQSGVVAKSLGMQVNDDGSISYFAVLKKMSSVQKEWIEKRAEKRAKEKEKENDKVNEKVSGKVNEEKRNDRVYISADSVDELLSKIEEFAYDERSNAVMSDEEKNIGQNIDFRG